MHVHSPQFGLDRTGGLLVLVRYLTELQRRGHRISVTTLGRKGDPRFVDLPDGMETTYLGLRGRAYKGIVRSMPGRAPFPRLEWRRLAAAAPSADLHVVGYSLAVRPTLERNEPVLYHVQHYEPLIAQGRLAVAAAEASYRVAPYVTANCSWVAERVTDAGGNVRAVIPPGFDPGAFTYVSPEDREPSEVVRVLTLGKAVEWKGLVDVVEATRMLAERLPDRVVELHSYGADQPRGALGRARSVHHGLVDLGRLAELQRSASMCVVGSWYESFPLPPLEAMASGTPVVTTRIGTEDYAEHEQNSLVVSARDPASIADAMLRLVEDRDLGIELAEAGRVTASEFTWGRAEDAFVEQVLLAAR